MLLSIKKRLYVLIDAFQQVLTKVLEEAGYARDCTLSLDDFMTVHI
jgi:hypothetical protein